MARYWRRTAFLLGVAALLAFSLFWAAVRLYTDWLWFGEVGYRGVFWTILLTRWLLRGLILAVFFLFLAANLLWTRKVLDEAVHRLRAWHPLLAALFAPQRVTAGLLLVAAALTLLGAAAPPPWEMALKYLYGGEFGLADPLFQRDVGFYVFRLPLLQYLYRFGLGLFSLAFLAVTALYALAGAFRWDPLAWRLEVKARARHHLAVLAGAFLLWRAWGYRLEAYQLLYSTRGAVFGAGYTDVHVLLVGLKFLSLLALVAAALVLWGGFARRLRPALAALVLLAGASLLVGQVYPSLVQRLVVEPNELAKEEPYLRQHIKFTRLGWGLDKIEEYNYPVRTDLTLSDVEAEPETVENVRLWDWRPLLATYNQLQSMRLYYDFAQVDVDRYLLDGRWRQVTLAARELNVERLPEQARTWVNLRLKYTHGYGLVMSPANEVTPEGLPNFFVANVPPEGRPDLAVRRPEIYFGELTRDYVVVRNRTPEFDYPRGDENAYTTYQGRGGIPLRSPLVKLAFALRLGTVKFFLSQEIGPESRIMIYREIKERVRRIAPFLKYDRDPYLVLEGGRLFWIQDAYVTTSAFPYAQPLPGWGNYARNSVKVVVDAYHGAVRFYAVDPREPLTAMYGRAFPGLFRPWEEMPAGLRMHVRYPEDLFLAQAQIYSVYHMEDPVVFYNKEDLWTIPDEIFASERVQVEPYYVIMRLPGREKGEFLLMLPFSPARKDNMVAWMAGLCDGEDYGRLVVYKFPKRKLTYGPIQVEARIDQDPVISQQLTLWNQRGSRVLRGNLLVIPLRGGILYVEPLYLQSEESRLPELKRVVAAYENRLVMDLTLERALQRLFAPGPLLPPAPPEEGADRSLSALARQAARLFAEAEEALARREWSEWGRRLEEVRRILEQLSELASSQPSE
ncbi:MAG: UPF0182 family protein [Bacillota bacterium]|nr:UPF0182 family protein [Bacillota bacterium]